MAQQPPAYNIVVQQQPQPNITVTTTSTQQFSTDWSTDVCDCCTDMQSCCFGCCCFQCMQCQTAKEIGWCCCMPMLSGMTFCVVSCMMRGDMREQYGIQGSFSEDALNICCCYCCSWCQMYREVKLRKSAGQTASMVTTHAVRG